MILLEKKKLNDIVKILANINYPYWIKKAKEDHTEHAPRVQGLITTLLNRNLITQEEADESLDGLTATSMKNMEKKADRVAQIILNRDDLSSPDLDPLYLKVLDWVNAWGGDSIGRPFYRGQNAGKRLHPDVPVKYKEGVIKASKGDIDGALDSFDSIDGIAMSYATKHLWFWSQVFKESGVDIERQPVYDKILSNALRGTDDVTKLNYKGVKNTFSNLAKNVVALSKNKIPKDNKPDPDGLRDVNLQGVDMKDIEIAIFSFMNTWFPKDNSGKIRTVGWTKDDDGNVINLVEEEKNYREAKAIAKLNTFPDDSYINDEPETFDSEVDQMDDDNITFKGDDTKYNYDRVYVLLGRGEDSTKGYLKDLADLLSNVNVRTLNRRWDRIRDELVRESKQLNESWNKWTKWATK